MTQIRPVVGLPTLTWLRAFEAAARTSSFRAAAAELNLTSGAISYQIRALEAHLGFALFERLPRGVKLTPMGVAYLPPVRKAFEELADSTAGLFGGSERVQITVHAPVSLAALWLAPRLPAFGAAHPTIDVRLSSVIWDNAVPDEATDLEIRYGWGQWHGYRSERLLNQGILAVCSPTLLRTARKSGDPAAWLPRQLIHIMGHESHRLKVRHGLALADVPAHAGPTVDTTIAALELAAAGAGVALAHGIFLGAYFATGRLVRALAQEFTDDNSYFVITPERPQRIRREARLFREWLVATAAECAVDGSENRSRPSAHN
ncbi:MAG TPA: LysR substrate-binding domain-containing protein [Steroidobacteraceae bacterium]|nr:LysR substrate-binding domain-containing protein [Steroidobacteraceae bacterium]